MMRVKGFSKVFAFWLSFILVFILGCEPISFDADAFNKEVHEKLMEQVYGTPPEEEDVTLPEQSFEVLSLTDAAPPAFTARALAAGPTPTLGLDVLSLAGLESRLIVDSLPENWAIGVLDGTFGNVVPKLEEVLRAKRVSAFRAHLLNGPCARNRNCERGEPKPTDLRAIESRARKFQDMVTRVNTPCYLSPVLEHDVTDRKTVDAWFEIIRRAAPSCIPVCSAYRGYCPRGILSEKHGNQARGDIISNDGESLFDAPSGYKNGAKVIAFGWIHSFNKRAREGSFVMPRARTLKPSREEIARVVKILSSRAPTPSPLSERDTKGCGRILKAEDGLNQFVWKIADRHEGDNRPPRIAWLSPTKYQSVFRKVQVWKNGRVVDTFRYRHPFTEHGRPYRHIYDSTIEPKRFPQNAVLKADNLCWVLKNPTGRID